MPRFRVTSRPTWLAIAEVSDDAGEPSDGDTDAEQDSDGGADDEQDGVRSCKVERPGQPELPQATAPLDISPPSAAGRDAA
jgi:hypothetical protein